MNQNAKLWIETLRSGKFKQGRGHLKVRSEEAGMYDHCCLGVACELYKEATGDGEWRINDSNYPKFVTPGDPYPPNTDLPDPVTEWLGLAHRNGRFYENGDTSRPNFLSNVNDRPDSSFEEVADIIESEPEGLFAA